MNEYYAFSDESNHTMGRFRSIAALSMPRDAVVEISARFQVLLSKGSGSEFKWKKLDGARRAQSATSILSELVSKALTESMRADVVIWDTHDLRHAVRHRDDTQNYERMFFHLHRALVRRRPAGSVWHIRPDEQVAIDWGTIADCLNSQGSWKNEFSHPLLSGEYSNLVPSIRTIRQVDSKETPLCQVADLLAGMAQYTANQSDKILAQIEERSGQGCLFTASSPVGLSKRDRRRFEVIWGFNELCKQHKLGVSLASSGCLRTLHPSNPLNFWHYEPQHEMDKAPSGNSR